MFQYIFIQTLQIKDNKNKKELVIDLTRLLLFLEQLLLMSHSVEFSIGKVLIFIFFNHS